MGRIGTLIVALAVALGLVAAPAAATGSAATPYGLEDNPLGTIGWLPSNANETAPGGQFRLTVVYDSSIDEAGMSTDLLANGPFGVKFFTSSPDIRMASHSPHVTSLDDVDGNLAPADPVFMGVAGDVRDGDCAKVGTSAFSAAYSITRSFFHEGAEPYSPASGPGLCEVVDSSDAVTDGEGNVIGYTMIVTNHVPGFWINVTWPTQSAPLGLGNGYRLAEVWYGSYYDSEGEDGEWYEVADTTGQSTSTGSPGEYSALFRFTANPGALGPSCTEWDIPTPQPTPVPDVEGTWDDVGVQVPAEATRVTFRLFPKADWDLIVLNPDNQKRISGDWALFDEQVVAPGAGAQNFPTLVTGEYTMRACNFSGETGSVLGGVIIEGA